MSMLSLNRFFICFCSIEHLGKGALIASCRNPKTSDYDPMVEEVSFSCHLELHFTIVTHNR
ncbi:hypothetical protein Hanom_Chr07g00645971 [Helianthus anomalus]